MGRSPCTSADRLHIAAGILASLAAVKMGHDGAVSGPRLLADTALQLADALIERAFTAKDREMAELEIAKSLAGIDGD